MDATSINEPTQIELSTLSEGEFEMWANADLKQLCSDGCARDRTANAAHLDPSAGSMEVLSSPHYLDIVLRDEEYSPVKGRMKFTGLDEDDD